MVTKRKKAEQEAEKKRIEEEELKKKAELPQNEVSDADYFAQFMCLVMNLCIIRIRCIYIASV